MNNLYLAKSYAYEIEKCLAKKGVKINLYVVKDREPRYVFRIGMCKTTSTARLRSCIEDLQLYLEVPKVEIIDKGSVLYLAILTERIKSPKLTSILRHQKIFENCTLAHPVGVDDTGRVIIEDLAEYPHLMVSGTTKSGKSVALKCLLLSLLQYSPEHVNLIICDQTLDFSQFSDLPHLSYPVVQDNETFIKVILLLKEEMERRVSIEGTDEYKNLPYIVGVVDEFPAFVSTDDSRKNQLVVEALQSILRRGRHGRIHLVLAANDPKKGNIKIDVSDIPAKMAFRTANFHNSVTAIGIGGAEQLKEKGEMYFSNGELKHLQGFYISPNEITKELDKIQMRQMRKNLSFSINQYLYNYSFHISDISLMRIGIKINKAANRSNKSQDELLPPVIMWALTQKEMSTNAIKTKFKLGWNRASSIMNELTALGIVSKPSSTLPRKVIPQSINELSPNVQDLLKKSGYYQCTEDVSANSHTPKLIKRKLEKLKYI